MAFLLRWIWSVRYFIVVPKHLPELGQPEDPLGRQRSDQRLQPTDPGSRDVRDRRGCRRPTQRPAGSLERPARCRGPSRCRRFARRETRWRSLPDVPARSHRPGRRRCQSRDSRHRAFQLGLGVEQRAVLDPRVREQARKSVAASAAFASGQIAAAGARTSRRPDTNITLRGRSTIHAVSMASEPGTADISPNAAYPLSESQKASSARWRSMSVVAVSGATINRSWQRRRPDTGPSGLLDDFRQRRREGRDPIRGEVRYARECGAHPRLIRATESVSQFGVRYLQSSRHRVPEGQNARLRVVRRAQA